MDKTYIRIRRKNAHPYVDLWKSLEFYNFGTWCTSRV